MKILKINYGTFPNLKNKFLQSIICNIIEGKIIHHYFVFKIGISQRN